MIYFIETTKGDNKPSRPRNIELQNSWQDEFVTHLCIGPPLVDLDFSSTVCESLTTNRGLD